MSFVDKTYCNPFELKIQNQAKKTQILVKNQGVYYLFVVNTRIYFPLLRL